MKKKISKKSTVSLALLISLGMASAAQASAAALPCSPLVWREVKMMARNCIDQKKSGHLCDAIQVFAGRSAIFNIAGDTYRVRMEDSAYSDGGDLDDLYIDRDDGCQLVRKNIPAYGDLVAALAR